MTHYISGRRAEWLARNELTKDGYTVVRAAGSKGKIDLVAWNFNGVKLIQVKKGQGRVTVEEYAALNEFDIPAHSTVEVWQRRNGEWTKNVVRERFGK